MTRTLPALAIVLALAAAARAEPTLTADLSAHQIVLSGSGSAVTLFGTTDSPGDVVVVVRGPEADAVIRRGPEADAVIRRGPFDNFWLTAHRVAFGGVPSFYAVYASAPLDAIVSPEVQALHQLGLANLRFQLQSTSENLTVAQQYRDALVAERERAGLYIETVGKVVFDSSRLFHATLPLPADAPSGSYFVEVLLLRDKALVGGQTMALTVAGGDVGSAVGGVADWMIALYSGLGLLAVFVAGGAALWLHRRRLADATAAPAPRALRKPRPQRAKGARRR